MNASVSDSAVPGQSPVEEEQGASLQEWLRALVIELALNLQCEIRADDERARAFAETVEVKELSVGSDELACRNSDIPRRAVDLLDPAQIIRQFRLFDTSDERSTANSAVLVTETVPEEESHQQDMLIHVRVLRQLDPVSCGYYAFHNAICALRALLTKDLEASKQDFLALRSVSVQAARSMRARSLLSARAIAGPSTACPWTLSSVRSGSLERSHLKHLLSTTDCPTLRFGACGGLPITTIPEFSPGSLKCGVLDTQTMLGLHATFDEFAVHAAAPEYDARLGCTDGALSRAFIIGALNHWVAVVAHRHQPGAPLELLYMDSRDHDHLVLSPEEVTQYVHDYYERKIAGGMIITHRTWRQQVYTQSLIDSRWICFFLGDLLNGRRRFIEYVFELIVDDLLESFDSIESSFACIEWIQTVCPARMLTEGLIEQIRSISVSAQTGLLSSAIVQKIDVWIIKLTELLRPCADNEVAAEFLQAASVLQSLCSSQV